MFILISKSGNECDQRIILCGETGDNVPEPLVSGRLVFLTYISKITMKESQGRVGSLLCVSRMSI
ncbi:hypothetical protein HK25_04430 [Acetobacter sp. DsW_059]|nr:hypothetical protein HK25_04430 [Acetobacter sp. DsW_059]